MITFFATFATIEWLLPRLYVREFREDYARLMHQLERELISELQIGLTFQIDEMFEISTSLDRADEELTYLTRKFERDCPLLEPWQPWRDFDASLVTNSDLTPACEETLIDIDFLINLTRNILTETENWAIGRPVEWFHLKQMREHHEQHASTPYLTAERILNNFAMANNVRIWVWDIPAGSPFGDLGETLFYIEGRPAELEFMTELGETELGVREQRFHDPETGGFAIAISGTFQPAYRILSIISTLQRQLLIIIFFISLIISLLFSRYLARPIVALSEESKKLRNLQFDETFKIKRLDEIGDLSTNLNYMSFELKRTLDLLQDANQRLKIEMEKEREQERQRRNLFTSISHELKTPITILKGEIGGMIDEVGDYKDRDIYLKSAYDWTEILEKLVLEILTITRLEGDKMHLDFKSMNLSELTQEIINTHKVIANKQNVTLQQNIIRDIQVKADASQLKIAISNILNNAIFYTQPQEKVFIELKKTIDLATLIITNTGAYIEQDALENLFNPFYRIDRSRNRHTGGSGLGLFIVKNILDLHDFEYQIENVEEGVRFTIKIPL